MTNRIVRGAFATAILCASFGCAAFRYQHGIGVTAEPPPEPVASHSGPAPQFAEVQAIFTRSCAIPDCHRGGLEDGPPEGLDLSEGKSYGNLVGVKAGEIDLLRVAPGKPDVSYLYRKITPGAEIAWHRMPLDRPELPAAERQLIRDWIAAGAKDR